MPYAIQPGGRNAPRGSLMKYQEALQMNRSGQGVGKNIDPNKTAQANYLGAKGQGMKLRAEISGAISQSPKAAKNILSAYNQETIRARMERAITPDNPKHVLGKQRKATQDAMTQYYNTMNDINNR